MTCHFTKERLKFSSFSRTHPKEGRTEKKLFHVILFVLSFQHANPSPTAIINYTKRRPLYCPRREIELNDSPPELEIFSTKKGSKQLFELQGGS